MVSCPFVVRISLLPSLPFQRPLGKVFPFATVCAVISSAAFGFFMNAAFAQPLKPEYVPEELDPGLQIYGRSCPSCPTGILFQQPTAVLF